MGSFDEIDSEISEKPVKSAPKRGRKKVKSDEKPINQSPPRMKESTQDPKSSEKEKEVQLEPDEEEKKITKEKSVSEGKPALCVRKDVVYKTLIRSLKRYLTDKVDLTVQKAMAKSKKEELLFSEIDQLMDKMFIKYFDKNESNRSLKEIVTDDVLIREDESIRLDPENLKIYLWIIIIPESIKPYLKNQKRRISQKLMYDWLYKYSHKKLDRLFKCEHFAFLFTKYVELQGFDQMVEVDDTLKRNKEVYQEACDFFMSSINKFNN